VSTGLSLHRSVFEILPAVRRAGVLGVEIGTPPGHFHPERPAEVEALLLALRSDEVAAVSIHAPFGRTFDLASRNPEERGAGVRAAITAGASLARLGGRLVVAHPSDFERDGQDVAALLELSAASLNEIGRALREFGLRLVVETPLPHLVGGHPDEFQWLLSRLDPLVGACLDTGHASLGHHWHRLLEVAGDRLAHVHASDNHGSRDDHLPPGDGRLDWREISRTLRVARFDGWVMLELHGPDEEPETYLRRALGQAMTLVGG
jgi:sugar phosphate isomerase/epimerase